MKIFGLVDVVEGDIIFIHLKHNKEKVKGVIELINNDNFILKIGTEKRKIYIKDIHHIKKCGKAKKYPKYNWLKK